MEPRGDWLLLSVLQSSCSQDWELFTYKGYSFLQGCFLPAPLPTPEVSAGDCFLVVCHISWLSWTVLLDLSAFMRSGVSLKCWSISLSFFWVLFKVLFRCSAPRGGSTTREEKNLFSGLGTQFLIHCLLPDFPLSTTPSS